MPFSAYLEGVRQDCRELVARLGKSFRYVSILGTDVRETNYYADFRTSAIREGDGECGFVVKLHNGDSFYEYSLDDISGDKAALAEKILKAVKASPALESKMLRGTVVEDAPLVKDFVRESDFDGYTDDEILKFCKELRDQTAAADEKFLNVATVPTPFPSCLFQRTGSCLSTMAGSSGESSACIRTGKCSGPSTWWIPIGCRMSWKSSPARFSASWPRRDILLRPRPLSRGSTM